MFASDNGPIRVVLVDDHRAVLWGLAKLIESARPTIELAECATCHRETIAAMEKHAPNVVLLDLDLGQENGLDLIPQLREKAAVIILTGSRNVQLRERAVLEGARGIIEKTEPAEVILKAIRHVNAGEPWVDRGTMGRLLHVMSAKRSATSNEPPQHQDLSPAERRVIGAVVRHKGTPAKVIAATMHISEHTLRNHLNSIYSKLGVHRRLDLVLYAMEHKLGVLPS